VGDSKAKHGPTTVNTKHRKSSHPPIAACISSSFWACARY
jgi:hypothetical protein